jgi:uncharacterized protein YfaS (alpha-2-macroglobulin family)
MLTSGTGQLNGMVTDPAGAAVAGVDVRLMNENNAAIARTNTQSDGQYTFSEVPPGRYRVEMESPGFRKNLIGGLTLLPAKII